MIHFDFDSCPKMAVIAPTSDAANQLFCFLRSETDVEWAGSETMDDTLWFHFTEQTVVREILNGCLAVVLSTNRKICDHSLIGKATAL